MKLSWVQSLAITYVEKFCLLLQKRVYKSSWLKFSYRFWEKIVLWCITCLLFICIKQVFSLYLILKICLDQEVALIKTDHLLNIFNYNQNKLIGQVSIEFSSSCFCPKSPKQKPGLIKKGYSCIMITNCIWCFRQ